MPDSRDHQSVRQSERIGYERLREVGIRPDEARRAAREAAEEAHRRADRAHSDRRR